MSDPDARWPTTTPQARLTPAPDKVPVRDALRPGTRLDEFEIVRVLGTGGFGIVYLARDHVLQRDVAIKEYMPAVLARRGDGATVSMRSTGACAETFAKGLESFLGEARLLASFDHPALVKVHRFWRSNSTAYMAMPCYRGQTLKDVRLQMPGPPDEAWLSAFIQPLLGALELLHGQGVFHRDISPDNILMLPGGQPVLLDFGSARRVVANSSQWLTAHLKPQFAPLEQYADEAGMRQGPWTDLYALGATLHFVITGRAPTPSVVRAVRDVLPKLSSLAPSSLPSLPARLLATIDWTLALAPDDRPQDVDTVRRALRGEIAPPPSPPRVPTTAAGAAHPPQPGASPGAVVPDVAAGESQPSAARPASPRGTRLRAPSSLLFIGLAVLGAAVLGWGADALHPSASTVPSALTLALESQKAAPRLSQPPALLRAVVAPPSADPVALRVSTNAPSEYSLWDMPLGGPSPPAEPSAAAIRPAMEAVPAVATVATLAPVRAAATERGRAARARPRATTPSAKAVVQRRKNACSTSSGLVANVMCVVNPCRDPRTRASAQCVDRQRAEQQRLRRLEQQ